MALDQKIIDILNQQAETFNQHQARDTVARVLSSEADFGRFCFYDVLLFPKSAFLGKHVLRISHASPGPPFPADITFSAPGEPKRDIAASPEVLAERVRDVLASESR